MLIPPSALYSWSQVPVRPLCAYFMPRSATCILRIVHPLCRTLPVAVRTGWALQAPTRIDFTTTTCPRMWPVSHSYCVSVSNMLSAILKPAGKLKAELRFIYCGQRHFRFEIKRSEVSCIGKLRMPRLLAKVARGSHYLHTVGEMSNQASEL
jgi:hypothetical protein